MRVGGRGVGEAGGAGGGLTRAILSVLVISASMMVVSMLYPGVAASTACCVLPVLRIQVWRLTIQVW